MENKIS